VSVYVSEGLEFREEIEEFLQLCQDSSISALAGRKAKAKAMYQKFCRSDSPYEVSLGKRSRTYNRC
jgi:hypothetical protein